VIVTVNDTPTVTILGPHNVCSYQNDTLKTSGSANITSYQWYIGGGLIGGATSSSYIATTSGTYTVVVTNSNSCTSTSAPFVVNKSPKLVLNPIITDATCSDLQMAAFMKV